MEKQSLSFLAILLLFLMILTAAGCSSESKPEDFVIEDGVVTEYIGRAKDVVIPDGVTAIAARVFEDSAIRSVVIPDSVLEIGHRAFCNCTKLTRVVLPDNGIILDSQSFDFCTKLADMVIPDSADVRSHAITNFNTFHVIKPAPELFNPGGQINYLNGITLCNMRFTEEGELRLAFVQPSGDLVPITFNADGTASTDYRIGFSVLLRMNDGSEVSAERTQLQWDMERKEYFYLFYFALSEKPKEIVVQGGKDPIILNGETWAEYKWWELTE